MQLFLSTLIFLVISGCASCPKWKNCPNPNTIVDSPKPSLIVPDCKDIKHLTKNAPKCVIQVAANQRATHIGLIVKEGERYKVSVPCKQSWYDCNSRIVPLCGEKSSFIQNLAFWKKRVQGSLLFSVIAEVIDGSLSKVDQFDLCSRDGNLKISKPGMLIMFPNDADGFFSCKDEFYENNRGKVWLNIQYVGND